MNKSKRFKRFERLMQSCYANSIDYLNCKLDLCISQNHILYDMCKHYEQLLIDMGYDIVPISTHINIID